MGFFSSRKAAGTDAESDSPSVTQVIRSRFYSKQKGKRREEDAFVKNATANGVQNGLDSTERAPLFLEPQAAAPSAPHRTSIVPSSSRSPADAVTATLAQRLNELSAANSQGLLTDEEYRLLKQDLFERLTNATAPTENHVVPVISPQSKRSSVHGAASIYASSTTGRPPSSSNFYVDTQPTRSPSVKSKSSIRSGFVTGLFNRTPSSSTGPSRRTPSSSSIIHDTSSIVSGGTSRSATNNSIFRNSGSRLRSALGGSRNGSSTSVASMASNTFETMHHPRPQAPSLHQPSPILRPTSRSHGSIRKLALQTPPSSFHGRLRSQTQSSDDPQPPIPSPSLSHPPLTDEDMERLESSEEIKDAIISLEAEKRRLADAFHGLELSTLTKRHTARPRRPELSGSRSGSSLAWESNTRELGDESRIINTPSRTSSHHGRSPSSAHKDPDAMSVRSGASVGTMFTNNSRSMYSNTRRKPNREGSNSTTIAPPLPSSHTSKLKMDSSLSRQSSNASMASSSINGAGSRSRSIGQSGAGLTTPPVPTMPATTWLTLNHSGVGSSSSINLAQHAGRSTNTLPLESLAEDDSNQPYTPTHRDTTSEEELERDEKEKALVDLRRRRAEVLNKYDQRVEYLRAKLRGAELKEKLLKR